MKSKIKIGLLVLAIVLLIVVAIVVFSNINKEDEQTNKNNSSSEEQNEVLELIQEQGNGKFDYQEIRNDDSYLVYEVVFESEPDQVYTYTYNKQTQVLSFEFE